MGLALRILGALMAGVALVASVGALHYGVGQGALGLVQEPQHSFAPAGWQAIAADRPVRVLLLGTSLTASGTWDAALQAQLSACRPGGVVVERLARPGANSAWGRDALDLRLQTGPAPDLLVIEFTINDASLWHGMTLGKSHARHSDMLAMAQQAGIAATWLSTMSPAFGREAWERPGQTAYRAAYADLAHDQGAGLIALTPVWQALTPAARAAAMPDGLHPTDAAMQAITTPALAANLAAVLCGAG